MFKTELLLKGFFPTSDRTGLWPLRAGATSSELYAWQPGELRVTVDFNTGSSLGFVADVEIRKDKTLVASAAFNSTTSEGLDEMARTTFDWIDRILAEKGRKPDWETKPPYHDEYTGPRFKYGMKNRPMSIGTQPKGSILGSYRADEKIETSEGMSRYGTLEYPFPLTAQEIASFELLDLNNVAEKENHIFRQVKDNFCTELEGLGFTLDSGSGSFEMSYEDKTIIVCISGAYQEKCPVGARLHYISVIVNPVLEPEQGANSSVTTFGTRLAAAFEREANLALGHIQEIIDAQTLAGKKPLEKLPILMMSHIHFQTMATERRELLNALEALLKWVDPVNSCGDYRENTDSYEKAQAVYARIVSKEIGYKVGKRGSKWSYWNPVGNVSSERFVSENEAWIAAEKDSHAMPF